VIIVTIKKGVFQFQIKLFAIYLAYDYLAFYNKLILLLLIYTEFLFYLNKIRADY